MSLTELKALLETLASLATIIGIPMALIAFLNEKRKERRERELQAYVDSNARYTDFLRLCLDHPDFELFRFEELELAPPGQRLTQAHLKLFAILISMLEAGYILYADQRRASQLRQWRGWHDYMVYWCTRADFREAWRHLGPQFDAEFVRFMNRVVESHSQANPAAPAEATPGMRR